MQEKIKTPKYIFKYFGEPYNNKPTPKNVLKWLKRKKDNSKNGDMFLNCRSCKTIITNDYRSKLDTRDCADCL